MVQVPSGHLLIVRQVLSNLPSAQVAQTLSLAHSAVQQQHAAAASGAAPSAAGPPRHPLPDASAVRKLVDQAAACAGVKGGADTGGGGKLSTLLVRTRQGAGVASRSAEAGGGRARDFAWAVVCWCSLGAR